MRKNTMSKTKSSSSKTHFPVRDYDSLRDDLGRLDLIDVKVGYIKRRGSTVEFESVDDRVCRIGDFNRSDPDPVRVKKAVDVKMSVEFREEFAFHLLNRTGDSIALYSPKKQPALTSLNSSPKK